MHFVRFFAYIAPCLSVARATFSVTVGTPTQCDPLTVSWTGGQAPFEILLTPADGTNQNYSVPASAFSNGKGSYSISQLLHIPTETPFLLTMSDATGFGTGGTTNELYVANPTTNNNCNTTLQSPSFTFQFSPQSPTQCGQFTVLAESTANLPITIVQLIPGGQSVVFYSNSDTFTSVVDVNLGTTVAYFVTDSEGRPGGVGGFATVDSSSGSSCLSANSPSSTIGMSVPTTTSPTSSSSSSSSSSSPSPTSSSSSSNVAIIAGAAGGGGGAVVIALVILGMCLCRKRRASHSPDIQSSTQSHPRQLQRADQRYEASSYSDVPPQSPFPHKTNPLSYHTQPIQPSLTTQSDLTNSSTGNFAVSAPPSSFNQTQHSRQSSNTDFPVYGDARSSAMSSAYNQMSQPMSPNYPVQYPVGYPPPVRPDSQSPPLNPSTGNFTFSDHPTLFNQTLHSHQSPNANFAVYGDPRSSATMSSVGRRMSTITETPLPLPWETGPVSYIGSPIQSGSQPYPVNAPAADLAARDLPTAFNQTQPSHKSSNTDFAVYGDARMSDMTPVEHVAAGARPASPLPQKTNLVYLAPPVQPGSQSVSTSAGKVAVSNPPTTFNQTQNSRQGPDTDNLAVHGASDSQFMASASAQTAATAAGQTTYQLPTQIIVHTDADDAVPAVVELPPQYSEHRGVRALQSEYAS